MIQDYIKEARRSSKINSLSGKEENSIGMKLLCCVLSISLYQVGSTKPSIFISLLSRRLSRQLSFEM